MTICRAGSYASMRQLNINRQWNWLLAPCGQTSSEDERVGACMPMLASTWSPGWLVVCGIVERLLEIVVGFCRRLWWARVLIPRGIFMKSNYSATVAIWSASLVWFLLCPNCGFGDWCQLACEPHSLDSPQRGRRLSTSNWTSGMILCVRSLAQFGFIVITLTLISLSCMIVN